MLRAARPLLVLVGLFSASPAGAVVHVFEPPAVDRWNYPFNGTPGIRQNAPVFGAFQTAGSFDERDGQQLLIFDTAPAIPAGRPLTAYQITQARVILDRDPLASFLYDPTQDGYRTYLALENPADPDQLPDLDLGRPTELFGTGYRLPGLDATTYDETGTPYGGMGQGLRYAYASDHLAHPTLFGARDVSNNVLGRFEATPFAVGVIPGATPGSNITGAGIVQLDLTLAPQVTDYLRRRLASGSVDFTVTSLTPAAFGGAAVYPIHLNKESGSGAATLEIDVTVTPACADGADNDGDGAADYPLDAGCRSGTADTEVGGCQNGVDDDGDGLTDYPADPGCFSATYFENPQCDNGIDDDADGFVDFDGAGLGAADPQCSAGHDDREGPDSCGLGFEAGIALLAIQAVRSRRARARRAAGGTHA